MPQLGAPYPIAQGLLGAVLSGARPLAAGLSETENYAGLGDGNYRPRQLRPIWTSTLPAPPDFPEVVRRPDRVTVPRGMTVERLSRNTYGDNWRAGVQAIVAANRLRFNGNGSPLLPAGQEVELPNPGGLSAADLSSASRGGGRLVAHNTERLAENRELQRLRNRDTSRYAGLVGEEREEAIQDEWERLENVGRIAVARAVVKDRLVPRSQWAMQAPDTAHLRERKAGAPPYHIETLHHTGRQDTPERVENLHRGAENWWRAPLKALGLPIQTYENGDVGYNYMIGPGGRIYEGRSLAFEGAHVRGHNPGNIGIAMLGDYSDKPLTKEQLESLKALLADLQAKYPIDGVKTHGDFDPVKADELKGARSQIAPLLR